MDFKNWKLGYPDEKEKKLAEIRAKLNAIDGKKAFIINIVKKEEFEGQMTNDGSIIEIPGLLDENIIYPNELAQLLFNTMGASSGREMRFHNISGKRYYLREKYMKQMPKSFYVAQIFWKRLKSSANWKRREKFMKESQN